MVSTVENIDQAGAEMPRGRTKIVWYHSLFWKITVFLVSSIVLAYIVGAAVGWVMVERDSLAQWRREAELNAQVTSSAIRTIYTFIAIESNESGQIVKIVSERPLGDDASILDTGFNPGDVLGLAAAQTKNNVWLFQKTPAHETFVSSADAFGEGSQIIMKLPDDTETDSFYVGFAKIGDTRHFIAFVPVVNQQGQLQGGIVSTIGEAADLFDTQTKLLQSSLALLITILLATSVIVTLLMRKVFTPVPSLIAALSKIAHDDTTSRTPFQDRNDEIGRFAVAIERVREAVVERENLRQVRDVAKQMEHLAHHDPLTGLPNRAFFNKRLDGEIAHLSDGRRFNVMLLDLDRFKAVNDSLGHASGDALLVSFAERLTLLMGPHDMVARLGGDEFAILQMVRKDPVREASRLCKAVIEAAARPFILSGKEAVVGTSIGIVTAPAHGHDVSELLKDADVALYCAKSEGRGRFRFFEHGMEMSRDRDNEIQHELDKALQHDELELHYQPIFSFSSSDPVAFEALVRWKHPVRGWISPAEFIPVAEKTGQICAIGDWVLQRACLDAARLPNEAAVAVNVSAVQLQQGDIAAKVQAALEESGLPPSRLEIELTETVLLTGPSATTGLEDIHALGVSVVLDDFGTGYSSLTYLMTLPISKIKIDRSFVADVMSKSESRAIIQGLIHIAEGLGLKTTAEGVETQEQLSLLRAAGCDLLQGYHLGRPMTVTEIESRYRSVPERRFHR
ncbi:EAL domain-containing protein [Agrobacterium larrymoorei]|uniref:EAL domain-containing protein n=1 Tax=Agrobacterium larrymoorei TaxID=160699 RepID=A0A4D7E3N6_9HYPH|nr:EAL domain-containing protein [Agrobacterium larrymoorei]QCI99490.1 EAL domain-containing protein [Agrobacterium larrymoorei]QYA09036.1 EAL domain-containing protein [Agrobacterium larrymoorei]